MGERREAPASTLPRIQLPNLEPPTPEEIERRRAVVRRIRQIRDEIGPIGVRAEDLIHVLRGGDERFDK
jgi:hypothetical protein